MCVMQALIEEKNVRRRTDTPVLTVDTLFSNLGGTLNLWLGITVLFAAEVIEVLFAIISEYYQRKRMARESQCMESIEDTTMIE